MGFECVVLALILVVAAVTPVVGAETTDERHTVTIVKRRMFYNDDGDTSLFESKGPFRLQMITDIVDVLVGTPITTLVFCTTPSDCTNYPSKVASMAGWRKTPSHASGYYRKQYEFYQWVREHNLDIPILVMERAIERGIEFIPSMRMNDAHFGQKVNPTENPWTGKFWMEHQNLAIGTTKFKEWGNEFLLDFKHKEVRDYKLALAFESIDRYG